ncbi:MULTISPECIES: GNAT family N-acetyltransferase [Bacillaceae]|uniref:GNAT family N-acetyltransferase n=1 Tax=Gottfriedia luciferensis TaxID=178774 RepID=A0ABX2ZN12_9BACI|nr:MULTISPECIES: GNAT family N-acetyltransferase [Bacillaceae]ODG90130.1 GNAT family N-acetyltransferase [Gottfriedia luciferensis]PGZ92257.1 N-acetyltransferase [Bacillus sp. AFS029533]SFC96698.1 Acetyltransferase (GNAT) family protein [Bacillus sp. UNCCL81]
MFNIIKVTHEQIEQVISLRLKLLNELGELKSHEEDKLIETSTREYLNTALSKNEFISFMVVNNGVPVSISGMVLFKRPPYLENLQGIEAYILNMYTVSEFRGKGLARKLLEKCIYECKKNGVKRVWLHASEDGRPLYKKMGFTKKDSEMELFL